MEVEKLSNVTKVVCFAWLAAMVIALSLFLLSSKTFRNQSFGADPQFTCLSSWDGSHREFKLYVRNRMRNPSSFEHVLTAISPPVDGRQTLYMEFRAENGFGGMTSGLAQADIFHNTCNLVPGTAEIHS